VKSVENAHVLFIPSWYHTPQNPVHGSFFRDQAAAVHKLGVRTGVVYADLRTLSGTTPVDWPGRRFQVVEEDDAGIPTVRVLGWRIPGAKKLTRQLWIGQVQRLIRQYVRRHGVPDVIHAHCVHPAGVAALDAKQNWRIPYLVTEHFSGYARGLFSDEMLLQARDVFSHAARLIAVSRKLAEDIRGYTGGRDIQVIPNLVDTGFFSMPEIPRAAEPFRFVFVGFLTPNKRVDDLLRAFAGRFAMDSTVYLEIVGDGVHRPALESLAAELGVGDRVEFSGLLSREGVRRSMQRANAFVSASEVETFGVVLLEAMATGLPVVVTRCGGPEEFVTDDVGRLVESGDPARLGATMEEVRRGYESWRDAAPAIRAYVESAFGERAVGGRIVEAYNSVISRH
jgi:glycosyltransferase involved in cell wall biosynthesis